MVSGIGRLRLHRCLHRLRVNYCLRECGSIAKCEVFLHYTELCHANTYVLPLLLGCTLLVLTTSPLCAQNSTLIGRGVR